jgi:hypothetical protein
MQEYLIITFATTTAALLAERTCKAHGMPGRLIPLPKAIDAGCGMAWAAPPEQEKALRDFFAQQRLAFAQMVRITF